MALIGNPVTAALTSWGSGSDFVAKLAAYNAWRAFTITGVGGTWDATRFGSARFTREGAGGRTVNFTGEAHLATPLDGYNGLFTFASGFTAGGINSWDMTITRPLEDVPVFGSQWNAFTPMDVSWAGTYEGYQDDTVGPYGPLLSGGWASATFQVISGGTGKQLSGNINYTQTSLPVRRGTKSVCSYSYKGDSALATIGSSTAALWAADADGSILSGAEANKTAVFTTVTGQTVSGVAMWSQIGIKCTWGQPIIVTMAGSFSGAVTGLTV